MRIRYSKLRKMIQEATVEAQALDVSASDNDATKKRVRDYLQKETHRYLEFYAHMTRPGTEYDLPAVLNGVFRYHKTDMKRDRKIKELLGSVNDAELKKLSDEAVMSYLKKNGLLKNLQRQK